jgi:hypothetical protein
VPLWAFLIIIKMAKEIKLTQGKVAIVDDEDFEYLNQWKWYANNLCGKFYAVRNNWENKKFISQLLMHRHIMNPTKGLVVDHCNGDTLNNTKSNLRVCTYSQNRMNSVKTIYNKSGYKGVCWHKTGNKWVSKIEINKTVHYLGLFSDLKEAAKAYNDAAIKFYGEFAKLNII